MTTIQQLLKQAESQLNNPEAKQESEYLLSSICAISITQQHTYPDKPLTEQQLKNFNNAIKRRLDGEPIAHITGSRGFWDMELKVTPDVLIPRPDTECLVEQSLLRIPQKQSCQVADLGTGSGAIALAIARERSQCQITATDKSNAALQIAKENAEMLGVKNIDFICGSWLQPLRQLKFDIIISNPPYIPANDPHLQQGDLLSEPIDALVSGLDGLEDIEKIIANAKQNLKQDGYLLLEHGYDQYQKVSELFNKHGYKQVFTIKDHGGNERVTGASF